MMVGHGGNEHGMHADGMDAWALDINGHRHMVAWVHGVGFIHDINSNAWVQHDRAAWDPS